MRFCNSRDKDLIVEKPKLKTFVSRKDFTFLRPCKSKEKIIEPEPEVIKPKKFVQKPLRFRERSPTPEPET